MLKNNLPLQSLVIFLFFSHMLLAQAPPANDDCANASQISMPSNGYTLGTFESEKVRLRFATTQTGEFFPTSFKDAGINQKSVWYKFSIPVTRSITLELKQNSTLIGQNAVGFHVYKTQNCVPDSTFSSSAFASIPMFGNSGSTCLAAGTYYVQVCANNTANDSIWISLVAGKPGPAPYDEKSTAGVLGTTNKSMTISTGMGCYSIANASEVCPSLGTGYTDYTQTAWFTFQTNAYPDYLLLKGSSADSAYKIGYNLFLGDARNAAVQLTAIDTGNVFNKARFTKEYLCGSLVPNSTYSIQLFLHKNAASIFTLSLYGASNDSTKSARPSTLPVTYRKGTLRPGQTYLSNDVISCNAKLSNNICGTAIPSPMIIEPLTPSYNKTKDTFEYNLWVTFRLPRKAILNSTVWMTDTNNLLRYIEYTAVHQQRCYIQKIFKGNVTNDCNLPLVLKRTVQTAYQQTFLDSGDYSMQLVFSCRPYISGSILHNMLFGRNIQLQLSCVFFVDQDSALFDKPSKAENLGDINAAPGQTKTGLKDFFGGENDNRTIGMVTMNNRSSYREFYLSQPSYIRITDSIKCSNVRSYFTYLFRGRASQNITTLKKVDAKYGPNPFTSVTTSLKTFESTPCVMLDTGWYSIISSHQVDTLSSVDTFSTKIQVSVIGPYQPNYDKPYKAFMVNHGNPLTFGPNIGTPKMPSYNTQVVLPVGCFSCDDDSVYKMCLYGNTPRKALYYVFSMATECHMTIDVDMIGSARFLLYRFNVKTDSLLLTDTSYLVRRCDQSNEFCRLQPGIYTLVMLDNPGCRSSSYTLNFEPVGYSAFDYAINSYDMGLIPPDNTLVFSAPDQFTCTTGFAATDPNAQSPGGTVYPIPENHLRTLKGSENNWFTFTLAGTGTVKVNALYSRDFTSSSLSFAVYRSDVNGAIPFATLRNNGQVDSTLAQGLTKIGDNKATGTSQMVFNKEGCDTARYYIITYPHPYFPPNYYVQTYVSYSGNNNINIGNQCTDAVSFSAAANGSFSAPAIVTCHNMGGSYGEDDSNMDCLFNGPGYKSTWYKFTLSKQGKSNLSFSLDNQTNASLQQIRYRILYGNCNAINPGPCVPTSASTFRIDCMLPGDYYIQVVSPAGASGIIKANVQVSDNAFPNCKASSPNDPVAKFTVSKDCNSGTYRFKNLSSAGTQIAYLWDFGNGSTSTEKSPVITMQPVNSRDTIYTKLVVHNITYNLYDSVIMPVYRIKDTIQLNAYVATHLAQKSEPVQLTATTNYANPVFVWTPATSLTNAASASPVSTAKHHQLYVLGMMVGTCLFSDSVLVNRYTLDSFITSQGLLCMGMGTITLHAPQVAAIAYKWSGGQTTASIQVNNPGIYSVHVKGDSLDYFDTTEVTGYAPSVPILGNDTAICAFSSVTVNALHTFSSYLWSNGDTLSSILIDTPGTYTLTIKDSLCNFTDTIVVSTFELQIDKLTIDTMCTGDTLTIAAPIGYQRFLWSTGDTTQNVRITEPGKYSVKLYTTNCFGYDTTEVKLYAPNRALLADTIICENDSVLLDAGVSSSYLWSTGDTGRFTTIHTAGTYMLRFFDEKCFVYDTVEVAPYTVPLSMPADTFYCYKHPVLLDAGSGYDSYLWQNGAIEQQMYAGQEGVYIVQVTHRGCKALDSTHVKMHRVHISLVNDTTICQGIEMELDAASNGIKYSWSTGETKKRILVKDAGIYSVIVSDSSCTDTASVNIRWFKPENIFGNDTSGCKPFELTLDAGKGNDFLWLPNGETRHSISINDYGTYIAIKTDSNGCMVSDTIVVKGKCDLSALYVPNVFTINDDGINDVFKAEGVEIRDFRMRIYNRWGEEVFYSDNINKGWNGNVAGQPAPTDVYVWTISYRNYVGVVKTESGNVTLLR
jgi:gliding motility-associated-like protein